MKARTVLTLLQGLAPQVGTSKGSPTYKLNWKYDDANKVFSAAVDSFPKNSADLVAGNITATLGLRPASVEVFTSEIIESGKKQPASNFQVDALFQISESDLLNALQDYITQISMCGASHTIRNYDEAKLKKFVRELFRDNTDYVALKRKNPGAENAFVNALFSELGREIPEAKAEVEELKQPLIEHKKENTKKCWGAFWAKICGSKDAEKETPRPRAAL